MFSAEVEKEKKCHMRRWITLTEWTKESREGTRSSSSAASCIIERTPSARRSP